MTKWTIENIVYPLMEKAKGNRIRLKTEELIENQKLNAEELRKLQGAKLRALLTHCIDNVPAYKNLAHLKEEIEENPFAALKKFPILEKGEFRQKADSFISFKADKDKLIPNKTGGSSGEPVSFFMDRPTVESYEAARWRGLSWWGISFGSSSVMVWGHPGEMGALSSKKYRWKERWLKNRKILSAFDLQPEMIGQYVEKINKFKPEYFYGYASALGAFAELMDAKNLKFNYELKGVVTTAESLHDFQREIIEKAFGCPVINEYGAKDGGIIAYECGEGNMHISADNLVIEVVDPLTMESLGKGKEGAFLITDLNNFSMARLRYKIGDMGALSSKKCSCGRSLPILKKLSGRESEMLLTRGGKLVHAFAFHTLVRALNTIKRYRIVQESPEKAKLYIVKIENNDNHEEYEKLAAKELEVFIKAVKEKFPGTEFDIEVVEEIPLKASGKEDYGNRNFELDLNKRR